MKINTKSIAICVENTSLFHTFSIVFHHTFFKNIFINYVSQKLILDLVKSTFSRLERNLLLYIILNRKGVCILEGIKIASVIINKRNEKGITQDELANFLGVSKASVSKWETSQNFPDIALLPKIASYFGISLDELMGYEPQMTNEQISVLHFELSDEFSKKPFNDVMNRCREIVRKYYSCFPLLFKISILYLNYGVTLKEESQKMPILYEAKELLARVKMHSDDIELKQNALNMEAKCELLLGNADGIISLLKDVMPPPYHKMFLAQAYIMNGNITDAKMELQEGLYIRILEILETLPPFLLISTDDGNRFEEIFNRTMIFIKIFNLTYIAPWSVMLFYITAAQGFVALSNTEKALDILEEYADLCTSDIYPLKIVKADNFFDLIENVADNFSFGMSDLPRDEKTIKQSMYGGVAENPAFLGLSEEPRFVNIVKKLKLNIGGKK